MNRGNRVAIITGGGTGIGRATAQILAAAGTKVVIAGRRPEPLDQTREDIVTTGGEAIAVSCDIRDPKQVEILFQTASDAFGSIDVLVNNAGGQFPASALNLSPNGWNAVLSTNLSGTFFCCQALARFAHANDTAAVIVNMTIPWFSRGCAGLSHAVAARAGVVALTKSLALEWAPLHVRVNCIAPGMVSTAGLLDEEFHGDESGADEMLLAIPLKRAASPEEVAKAIKFMVSDEASYMTGHTLVLDGGIVLGPGVDFLQHASI